MKKIIYFCWKIDIIVTMKIFENFYLKSYIKLQIL